MASFDIAKYYEAIVQKLPQNDGEVYVGSAPRNSAATEQNSASFLRGKSLFTAKPIKAGEVVFVERNIVSIVEPSSSKFVQTCDYCMRALGSLEDQVRFVSRILRKKGSKALQKADDMAVPFADEVRAYTKERVKMEREINGTLSIDKNESVSYLRSIIFYSSMLHSLRLISLLLLFSLFILRFFFSFSKDLPLKPKSGPFTTMFSRSLNPFLVHTALAKSTALHTAKSLLSSRTNVFSLITLPPLVLLLL